ncbi:sensor histidine kinase [Chitinophaga sp. HK235]|uniref:sensor histidine kinase n=1 Tax=Chitinophaga sp. HK235 TaxID=2952571 RepID=UPI001BACB3D8|nr:histidine kinase [Chitinophaga sp. HK235]
MKKSAVILLHTGYWLLYYLLILCFALVVVKGGMLSWQLAGIFIIPPIAIFCFAPGLLGFYTFYAVLFNRYLNKQRIGTLCIAGVVAALAIGTLVTCFLLPWNNRMTFQQDLTMVLLLSCLAAIHGVIGLVMKGFISWYGDIKLKEELNKKNFDISMALIKAQINPHFLFNTINNIDVLISKDAERASLYLNQLSGIMRFMLYEARAEQIPLSRELMYIDQYIALQRIRSSNASYVTYQVEGEPGNRMIAPMLLISYIENAFKHAEHKKAEDAIHIHLQIEPERLVFDCRNLYSTQPAIRQEHNGLGNELLQRRLTLLYPGRHQLHITREQGIYQVNLILETYEDQLHHC